uniref:Uncharacterized protein n=1 Tax=Arundo donax TaxID=35708 RepID=A0A0A9H6J9_ARUDO
MAAATGSKVGGSREWHAGASTLPCASTR